MRFSRWIVLTMLCLTLVVSCNDQRTMLDDKSVKLPELSKQTGRESFIVFDSTSYFQEREMLAELVRADFLDEARRIVRRWGRERSPISFWKEVHARTGVRGLLITWESGGPEGRGYTGMAVIRTAIGYEVAFNSAKADSIEIHALSDSVVDSVVSLARSVFKDSSTINCLGLYPANDVSDDGLMLLCSYVEKGTGHFIAQSSCDYSNTTARPLLETLTDLTNWRYAR